MTKLRRKYKHLKRDYRKLIDTLDALVMADGQRRNIPVEILPVLSDIPGLELLGYGGEFDKEEMLRALSAFICTAKRDRELASQYEGVDAGALAMHAADIADNPQQEPH